MRGPCDSSKTWLRSQTIPTSSFVPAPFAVPPPALTTSCPGTSGTPGGSAEAHYVYALTDYRETDRTIALARIRA
jgi:hypothetical protein